jgi:hypothetical protein
MFLEHAGGSSPRGFALGLADARALLTALGALLPQARHIQERIREQN